MRGSINDPAFPEAAFVKMQHVHELQNGENIVIHYWEEIATGLRDFFRLKNPPLP